MPRVPPKAIPQRMRPPFDLAEIPARDADGNMRVVVEAPRGSTIKLEWDRELGVFTIAKALMLGLRYPFDWGFVPGTLAPDGDPLDAMVLHDAATYPGVVIPCAVIGVIKLRERKNRARHTRRNDRVFGVPIDAPRYEDLRDVRDLPQRTRDELQEFFLSVVRLAEKNVDILGWDGPEAARKLIDRTATCARRAHG